MRWIARLGLFVFLALLIVPAVAQDGANPPPGRSRGIAWVKDLASATKQAKKSKRVVMVCVNAKRVDGRRDLEPAAKGLREVVYKDARVVKNSAEFVCVMLTKEGDTVEDYDILRKLGIDGDIISPQHIFIAHEGDRILDRKQYWSHGKGEEAVKVLLALMEEAKNHARVKGAPGKPAPEKGAAPEGGEARAKWIAGKLEQLKEGSLDRDKLLEQIVEADKDGDCTDPLIALLPLPEHAKDIEFLRSLIRVLGRDGLEKAALPIVEFLKHKDHTLRADAAVSLEYIGSSEKKVIAGLRKLADKNKDVSIANHAYRALGRCGVKDAKTRTLLLKKAASGKSEFATYGACIGLAYFEGDAKAARGVEKILKQIGIPGSRRGGGGNAVKRGLVSWTLASIHDGKSSKFVDEELIAGLEHVKAFWVQGLKNFWDATSRACDEEKGALAEVETGVGHFVAFAKRANLERYGAETNNLMDEYRQGREAAKFEPKGDNILTER